jgi:hypothetical protein
MHVYSAPPIPQWGLTGGSGASRTIKASIQTMPCTMQEPMPPRLASSRRNRRAVKLGGPHLPLTPLWSLAYSRRFTVNGGFPLGITPCGSYLEGAQCQIWFG